MVWLAVHIIQIIIRLVEGLEAAFLQVQLDIQEGHHFEVGFNGDWEIVLFENFTDVLLSVLGVSGAEVRDG